MSDNNKGVAIITGASSGIGKVSAIALAQAGWLVVVTARDEAKLKETAQECGGDQDKTLVVAGDLTSAGFVEKLFKETVDKFGRVDLIFNNAGASIGAPSFEEVKLEDFEKTLAINLIVPFNCIKHAFIQMKSQHPQGGRIINNGSISAFTPRPGSAGYTAAKHGISGLTKTAALDGRKYNIAVSQIDIGNAMTAMGGAAVNGLPQPDGSKRVEPTFDVKHVASSIVYMASLPLDANVLSHTIMATNMPSWVGRG